MISALIIIGANRPDLLEKIITFESHPLNEEGVYLVHFWFNRQPVIVPVDEYLPLKYDKPIFCKLD